MHVCGMALPKRLSVSAPAVGRNPALRPTCPPLPAPARCAACQGTGAAGFVSDFLSDTFSTSAGLGGRTFLQGNIGAAGYLQDTATDVSGP